MYTMMQVCRELNITYQTLKYYCNEGLVPGIPSFCTGFLLFCTGFP